MALAPPVARLLDNGAQREVAPGRVAVGSLLLVKPGEKIPLDGVVVRGNSAVNQAPITGESVPVTKENGSQVFAGTINGDGSLEMLRRFADTSRRRQRDTQVVLCLGRLRHEIDRGLQHLCRSLEAT